MFKRYDMQFYDYFEILQLINKPDFQKKKDQKPEGHFRLI